MKKLRIVVVIAAVMGLTSCSKYLDIVPDNVATLENAFTMRPMAEKHLFTCYSFLPLDGSLASGPAFMGGGEIFPQRTAYGGYSVSFILGQQNSADPLLNSWNGLRGAGTSLFIGLRLCNVFLENIYNVPDMDMYEKDRWAAEVKFLKAYYHFLLIQRYGPIPLVKENFPIDHNIDAVRVFRDPVDECFDYVVELLDEAIPDLPDVILDDASELGRITKPIAAAVKAWVLVTAASPLFNGNSDYADFIDKKGRVLFNQTYDANKWRLAMEAAKEAIDLCESLGMRLYQFDPGMGQQLHDKTITKLSIRNAVTEKWNPEIIWTWTKGTAIQQDFTPRTWDPARNHSSLRGRFGTPLNIVNLFYTENGVPLSEDKEWDFAGRHNIKTAGVEDRYDIKEGYQTVGLHFNREARFYATTGFDGGIWYGQGRFDDTDTWHLEGRAGGFTSRQVSGDYSPTSYWPKKLIHYRNVIQASSYSAIAYYWPTMRLADLYLLYAEAANEFQGPGDEAFTYLNKVRERAALPTVQEAWTQYSRQPTKFQSKEGLRDIIHQERQIELVYEAKRYWDLLRWKEAHIELSKPTTGWDLVQADPGMFYRETFIYQREFKKRDYFWPIWERDVIQNRNLLQNPGW